MSDGTYGCSPRPEPVPATQTFWIRGRLPGLSTSVTPQIRIEVHSAQQLITVRIVSVHEMQVQDDVWEFYANGNTLSHYGDGFYEVFVDVGGGWQYLDTHNIDGEEAPPVNPNPVNGDYDYCTDQGYQCASAEGDCDGNEDCQTGLQCIHDVGDWFGMAWDVDVCGQSEQVLSSVSTHRDCDDQYDWSFSDWSVCSARTGGTRTRSATLVQQNCLNPGSLPRVDVQNCDDFYSEDSQGWRIEAEGAYALQQNADQYPRIAPDCVDVDGTTLYSGLMFSGDHPGTNAQIIVPASPGTYDLWIAYRSHHSHWDNFAPEFYVEMNGQQFTVPSTRNYVPNGVEERFLGQMVVTSTTTNVTIRIGGEELMHYSSRWIEVDYLRGVLVQTTSPDAGVSDAGETDAGTVPDTRCNGTVLCYTMEAITPEGAVADEGSAGYSLTVNGGATLTTDRHGTPNSAYHFDGTGYLEATGVNLTVSGDFTMETWLQTEVTVSGGDKRYAVAIHSGNNPPPVISAGEDANVSFRLAQWGSNPMFTQPIYRYTDDIGEDISWYTKYSGDMDNGWKKLVVTREENLFTFYINGGSYHTGTYTDASAGALNLVAPNGKIHIGAPAFHQGTWPSYFKKWIGKIDDVKLYNRAKPASEVQSDFIAESTP